MRVFNTPNIIAANTMLNTTRNSIAIPLYQMFSFSIQIVFTGTPTGTFKLQASCDPVNPTSQVQPQPAPTNWTDISGSSFNVAAAGNVEWDYQMPGFNWVRVVYSDGSSGASTAIVTVSTFNGKGE